MSCGVGCRHGSDPMLLRLWRKAAAAGLIQLIQLLARELSYAAGMALKSKKKKKKKTKKNQKTISISIDIDIYIYRYRYLYLWYYMVLYMVLYHPMILLLETINVGFQCLPKIVLLPCPPLLP